MIAELQAENPIHLIMKKCICILAAILFAGVAFASNEPEPVITSDHGTPILKPRNEERWPLILSWFWNLFNSSETSSSYYEDDECFYICWGDMLFLPEVDWEE